MKPSNEIDTSIATFAMFYVSGCHRPVDSKGVISVVSAGQSRQRRFDISVAKDDDLRRVEEHGSILKELPNWSSACLSALLVT
jgi:hypothetical protein